MSSSFFFLQSNIDKNIKTSSIIDEVEQWSENTKTQAYIISSPLTEKRYKYNHSEAFLLLIPKKKISFIDFSNSTEAFEDYIEDFMEDLGSISDKYRYKDSIGRPRRWKNNLVEQFENGRDIHLNEILNKIEINDPGQQRIAELLVSLLTGSINDIDRVGSDVPDNILDKVKKNIVLFDGDQTRFIYKKINKKV